MKILAAEDNPVSLSLLRNLLTKWGYEVVAARDGNEALRILLSKNAPRLAILDWMMPGPDGVEVCRRVRAAGSEFYTYIALLTARTDRHDLVAGIVSGADDYLTKPYDALELQARLRTGRRIIELQDKLLAAQEALRQQATHDGLTGLLNSTAILASLHNEAARCCRERKPLSVLMVDLDHFKRINDSWGHLAGDAVLREAAARMTGATRRYDSVGRYGGEEFLVVLPGCQPADALIQAERLRLAINTEPFWVGSQAVTVTCCVGCASSTGDSECNADTILREADAALYRAKARGRNRSEAGDHVFAAARP